jgi:general stress protein CsbA
MITRRSKFILLFLNVMVLAATMAAGLLSLWWLFPLAVLIWLAGAIYIASPIHSKY